MSKHILVVDDNVDAAEMLGEILQANGCGFTVDIAFDGKQALEVADLRVPDIVLMDIEMPLMNGLVAARLMRSNHRTAGAHLIAITGRADYLSSERSSQAGFDHALVKPIDVDELLALIHEGPAR